MEYPYIVPCRCEHPVIILNPLVNELVAQYHNYTLRGKEYLVNSKKSLLYGFQTYYLQPKSAHITHDDLHSCFVTDYSDGKKYPLYLEVACGHCEICRASHVNEFVERCKLETQLYDCKPLFLTLTYDEVHKKECGLCLRDVQLFFKRLRINLYRKGYREKIRYALVGEYGRHTHRPHYHAIIWNLSCKSFVSYSEIRGLIEKSWSNGFCMLRLVQPCNDKAFYYTAKYLRKDCHVPSGCNKPFLVSSNRNGGIGSAFYYGLREHVRQTLNTKLKYVNKWSHKVADVAINRYALNKLLPSFSRSLPYSVRTRVKRFVLYYRYLYQTGVDDVNILAFRDTYEHIISIMPRYMYIEPSPFVHHSLVNVSHDVMLRSMLDDEECLRRVMRLDLETAFVLSNLRDLFVMKLLATRMDFNISNLVYKYRRQREMSHNYEVL